MDQCVEKVLKLLASHKIIPGKLVTDYEGWYKANQAAKERIDEPDDMVNELFVSEAQRSAAMQDAKSLPKLDISELDMQWIQVCNIQKIMLRCAMDCDGKLRRSWRRVGHRP